MKLQTAVKKIVVDVFLIEHAQQQTSVARRYMIHQDIIAIESLDLLIEQTFKGDFARPHRVTQETSTLDIKEKLFTSSFC